MRKIAITNKVAYILFILIIIIFILVRITNLNYSISDENTSFYIAKLMSEGKIVYKDIFYAHPPLQIYLFAMLYKIFGFNFLLLKITPLIFIIISSLFIFKIMQRHSNISALIAVLLLFFSYDSLRFNTYAMGINLTAMFLIISVYFLCQEPPIRDRRHDSSIAKLIKWFLSTVKIPHMYKWFSLLNHQLKIGGISMFEKKYLASGMFSGLAGITGLYSLVPIAVILIFLFVNIFKNQNKRAFFNFLIGFSLVFVLINLLFIILYGNSYITPVYKFHLLKPKGDSTISPLLSRIIKTNPLLFILPFAYFLAKKKLNLIVYISITYFLFLILFQKTFGHYFMILLPFLAIISAYSITKTRLKLDKSIIIAITILLIVISSVISSTKFIKYDFQDFNNASEIANFITVNSDKDETIFGDDSTTPLIALLSKRNIALDFADTNSLRFRSGIDDINELIRDLKKSENRFIIVYQVNFGRVTGTYGPAYLDEFFDYVKDECKLSKTFKEPWQNYEKIFSVYDCKKNS